MNSLRDNPRRQTLRRDLRSMMSDGASFSLMVGIGETYVPAFALALGLNAVAAGLVATAPMLAGGLLQLISPWAVRELGSHRRWVVTCASFQAISMVLLLALAVRRGLSPWLVFLPATMYWAAGLATGPAWNAWVERLVPRSIRASFFAQRTWISHSAVMLGLVLGGIILRGASVGVGGGARVFAILFAVGAVSRLLSAAMLARQSEPADEFYLDQQGISYADLLRGEGGGHARKLVLYLLAVHIAVNVAAPFFTPFMLVQLRLTYLQYMILLSCGFLGKILAARWAGRLAKRIGAERLLWLGGVAIVPLSAMWLVSNAIPFLIVLQIAGGVAWAAYELAMLLLFFETIPRDQRVSMLSLYNFGNAIAVVTGAVLGAGVMAALGEGRTPYLAVFALSSAGRLLALLLIPRTMPRTPRLEAPAGMRTIAVRPLAGSMERPILPTIESQPATLLEEPV